MWSRTTTCFCLLFLYFGFLSNCCYSQESCRTPDGIEATCADIPECTSIVNLIRTLKRPHSEEVKKKLRAYKCRNSNQVCCPAGTISLDPPIPEAPDVTHHRNIHLLPDECTLIDSDRRITNGENANLREFPFMALLQYVTSEGLQFQCSGTIINKNYILTAAHCLQSTDEKLVGVRVGEYSIKNETDCEVQADRKRTLKCNPPVQDLEIEEVIVHPQYSEQKDRILNDIALLRVSTIKPADNIFTVCLPRGPTRDIFRKTSVVTGWGVTDPNTIEKADILQRVGLPTADKATCAATYSESRYRLTNTQFCAGGKDQKSSCSGDSGGPLLFTAYSEGNFIYVQHGIVSFGPKFCGTDQFPGVYTMVKYYMDWILDNMKP